MKHSLFLIICFLFLLQLSASANENQVGDVIGQVYPVDIVTYFNNDPIPAYNTGGETAVLVADLGSYGFDVYFEDAVAYANYNDQKQVTPIENAADTDLSVLYSDIIVKINNIEVPAYNVDGHMAVPMERMCEVYAQTNKENEISPYSVNYIWDGIDRKLYLELSDDVVFYQDFMIQLLQAAKMDFDSPFYNDFVKQDKVENPNTPYLEKFTDIAGTKLETYIHLLDMADLIDADTYENGSKLHPYREVTRTDAAFLLSRILGSGIDSQAFFDYYQYSSDIPDFKNYEIASYDWYKVPTWSKSYFAYLYDIQIILPDENNYLCPYEFLTNTSAQHLINLAIEYMSQGIVDFDITITCSKDGNLVYFDGIHKLEGTSQIIDDVLYIPFSAIFNSYSTPVYPTHLFKRYKLDIANTYYFGTHGHGYTVTANSKVYNAYADAYGDESKKTAYPFKLLYGELMLPVYDYKIQESLSLKRLILDFDSNQNLLTITDSYYPPTS